MIEQTDFTTQVLSALIDLLEIPESYYNKAKKRHISLGEWFLRADSSLLSLEPSVYPQGSFRYGTVIRPLLDSETYDLDLVCQLSSSKTSTTQEELKKSVRNEIATYAEAQGMIEPIQEKHRCWRIEYADEVSFHLDVLPAVPEDRAFIDWLVESGVEEGQASKAIAITDNRHRHYTSVQSDWPRSNPSGFAQWFEGRMRSVAEPRIHTLFKEGLYASVDEVPAFTWKTPLQRSIQLLKRHRDVMFRDAPDLKPISMILTTLAARAYQCESDVADAIEHILDRMLDHVKERSPRVENPVNPEEDFADKWKEDDQLESNFLQWLEQAKQDFKKINGLRSVTDLTEFFEVKFQVRLASQRANELVLVPC